MTDKLAVRILTTNAFPLNYGGWEPHMFWAQTAFIGEDFKFDYRPTSYPEQVPPFFKRFLHLAPYLKVIAGTVFWPKDHLNNPASRPSWYTQVRADIGRFATPSEVSACSTFMQWLDKGLYKLQKAQDSPADTPAYFVERMGKMLKMDKFIFRTADIHPDFVPVSKPISTNDPSPEGAYVVVNGATAQKIITHMWNDAMAAYQWRGG